MIFFDLKKTFQERCQVNVAYPLVGGIGYGKFRISMVFRAITLQAPRELLGWDYGTLAVGKVSSDNLPERLQGLRIKLRGPLDRARVHSQNDGTWQAKHDRKVRLGIRNRYASCMEVLFRKTMTLGIDKTPAFGIFWLKDIPDNEERTVSVDIWDGDFDIEKARTHCLTDMGKKIGTLDLELKFVPGLGHQHRRLAHKNRNMKDVFEALDTANDNDELHEAMYDGDDNSSSSNDDGDGDDKHDYYSADDDPTDKHHHPDPHHDSKEEEEKSGHRGPIEALQDYRNHKKTLHRQHRGIMQWKLPRTAHWMKHKLDHGKVKIAGVFHHHDRIPDVDTET